MIPITKLTGRLGNQMFQFAALYSMARDKKTDFYFQDEQWFKKYENEIRGMYGIDIVNTFSLPYVGVHVRRGDYVGNSFYVDLCQTDYYEKAMALFPHKNFVIVSDDVEFCKKRFVGDNILINDTGNELEDLNTLARCEHNIIANSSFSWWAAYLNPNPNKIVVAPSYSKWYTDGNMLRTVIPNTWKRV